MLCWIDVTDTNPSISLKNARVGAGLSVRSAVSDGVDHDGKKAVGGFRLQAKKDQLGVIPCLHESNGVEKWRVAVVNVGGKPPVLANNLSDFAFHV